jgi:PKD repeat protein
VTVDATATSFLPSGTYHFQLVVVDEEGNQSDPVTATVVVKDTIKPTAVLTISPTQAQLGQTFTLDGSKSSDVAPGTLKSFIWTLVSKS